MTMLMRPVLPICPVCGNVKTVTRARPLGPKVLVCAACRLEDVTSSESTF